MCVQAVYAQIAEMEPGGDDLAFAWAVREQETLWLLHDHAFVEAANTGWADDEMLRSMLWRYGLLRGRSATLLAGNGANGGNDNAPNRAELARQAIVHAARLIAGAPQINSSVWQEFGQTLAAAFGQQVQAQDWFMPSATAKIMWFHRPEIVPMYDQYAAKEASDRGGGLPMPNNFFVQCAALLNQHQSAITNAKALWGSAYPYDIRVLDKFLWLRGNGGGGQILKRFQAGCRALCG